MLFYEKEQQLCGCCQSCLADMMWLDFVAKRISVGFKLVRGFSDVSTQRWKSWHEQLGSQVLQEVIVAVNTE